MTTSSPFDRIALVCAVTSDAKLVVVHQWKQGVRSFMLELPGGICDENEDPVVTAGRELTEETGYVCPNLTRLGSFEVDPSRISNLMHIYLGIGAELTGETSLDSNEQIDVQLLPLAEARDAMADGRLTSLGTVAGIELALVALASEPTVA